MTDILKRGEPEKFATDETTKDVEKKDDLNDEDKLLQEELDMLVERLMEPKEELYEPSLESLRTLIKASTNSMTSVPKPLKFLRKHFQVLKDIYEKMLVEKTKRFCADIISVLGMTMSEGRETLKFRLLGLQNDVGEWGHEYVRHLAGEIAIDWWEIKDEEVTKKVQMLELSKGIVAYNLEHNAVAEACDLAMELEHMDILEIAVVEDNHFRVAPYLLSCVPFVPYPENHKLLTASLNLYLKFQKWPESLRIALQLNNPLLVAQIVKECPDNSIKKQLAFIIARQQAHCDIVLADPNDDDATKQAKKLLLAEITDIKTNSLLNTNFMALARELDILTPKHPDDVFKTYLEDGKANFTQVDSAKQNLASSFVTGFVNAGFGKDKLLTEEGSNWLFKNKDHGKISSTAALGLILLWDVDGGLSQIDKYFYSTDENIKAGTLLAIGIVNTGVRNECDPALALLSDYISHNSATMKIGAILGLGLAYAGTNRGDILELISSIVLTSTSVELIGLACLASGLIAVGSANGEVTSNLMQCLMERTVEELKDSYAIYISLGLALNFLGKQEAAETIFAALEIIPEPFQSFSITLVEACAYAGTGNVLKIQKFLHICSSHFEDEEKQKMARLQQTAAAIGLGLIAMGEDIGIDMAFRSLNHLMRYGEPAVRKGVPLALALLSVSNPRLVVLDTLSKFSHDLDEEVALNSIFCMGIVAAGTNNARVAVILRGLATYHARKPNQLFLVRIAQGLVHMGKGTLGLSPFNSDRALLCPVAVAGLLGTLFSFLDVKGMIIGKGHYLLYCLATAMSPRMLATFDEDLKPLAVPVRVGQALDIVGVAGKPKSITGFQTYTTPVLLGHGERAELATEEYLPLSPILEGFVILRKIKNPL